MNKTTVTRHRLAACTPAGTSPSKKRGLLLLVLTLLCSLWLGCMVTQAAPKLSKTKTTLAIKQKTTLKVSGTSKKVTWKSSKPSVATVKSGVVTAKSAGSAVITAKVGTKSYRCTVTVKGDYRTIYKNFLATGKASYYLLLDVNRDGLPELLYHEGNDNLMLIVSTVYSGKFKILDKLWFSGAGIGHNVYYNKKQKGVYQQSMIHGAGGVAVSLSTVSGSKLKGVRAAAESMYGFTTGVYPNSKSVSKSAYLSYYNKYFNKTLTKYAMKQNTAANRDKL